MRARPMTAAALGSAVLSGLVLTGSPGALAEVSVPPERCRAAIAEETCEIQIPQSPERVEENSPGEPTEGATTAPAGGPDKEAGDTDPSTGESSNDGEADRAPDGPADTDTGTSEHNGDDRPDDDADGQPGGKGDDLGADGADKEGQSTEDADTGGEEPPADPPAPSTPSGSPTPTSSAPATTPAPTTSAPATTPAPAPETTTSAPTTTRAPATETTTSAPTTTRAPATETTTSALATKRAPATETTTSAPAPVVETTQPATPTEAPASSTGTSSSADESSPSPSSLGAVPVTTTAPGESGSAFHDLLAAFTTNDGTAFGRLRQILMITFGIGFVTAAGFITATWRSRVRIARAENLHRTDHGRRRAEVHGVADLFHR